MRTTVQGIRKPGIRHSAWKLLHGGHLHCCLCAADAQRATWILLRSGGVWANHVNRCAAPVAACLLKYCDDLAVRRNPSRFLENCLNYFLFAAG